MAKVTSRPLEEQVQEEEVEGVEEVEMVEENLVPMSARREGDVR